MAILTGTLKFDERGVESIELVEFYLEPCLVLLESSQKPINSVFSGFLKVFRVFRHGGGYIEESEN